MVLGDLDRKDTLYGEGYSVTGNGDLAEQLQGAIRRLPEFAPTQPQPSSRNQPAAGFHASAAANATSPRAVSSSATTAPSASRSTARPCRSSTAARRSRPTARMTGKRLAALVGLRDRARRVLQSQNEGWPEAHRNDARRELNWAYDRFVGAYGPINKTTFGETADGNVIRRMPNLVKFREDPDAMLVMSPGGLRRGHRQGRQGRDHAARTWWARSRPSRTVASAEEGLLVSLDQQRRGRSALHRHALRQAGGTGRSPSWAT